MFIEHFSMFAHFMTKYYSAYTNTYSFVYIIALSHSLSLSPWKSAAAVLFLIDSIRVAEPCFTHNISFIMIIGSFVFFALSLSLFFSLANVAHDGIWVLSKNRLRLNISVFSLVPTTLYANYTYKYCYFRTRPLSLYSSLSLVLFATQFFPFWPL